MNIEEILNEYYYYAKGDKKINYYESELEEYINYLSNSLDSNDIDIKKAYSEIESIIRTIRDKSYYGTKYYLNIGFNLLNKFYLNNNDYSNKILTFLIKSYNEEYYLNEIYYSLLDKVLIKDKALDLLKKAKKYDDVYLMIIAYDRLEYTPHEIIMDLDGISGYAVNKYLLRLHYLDNDIDYIKNEMKILNPNIYKKDYNRCKFYLELLNGNDDLALDAIRKACLYDDDIYLYNEYISTISTKEVEMKYYYDNRKWVILSKILYHYKYYDNLMDIIKLSKNYNLYMEYGHVLKDKYSNDYIEFFIGYIEKRIKKLTGISSYERLAGIVDYTIKLRPKKDQRKRLLDAIMNANDRCLIGTLIDEIEYLKGNNYLSMRYK